MIEKESQQRTQKRILILCVDRDGDIEVKAGIKTPVLGRTANLDAAVSLALHDPEEPDANAMFEAVRLYDRLQGEKKTEEIFEVATISGSELGGVGADRKLVAELGNLLGSFSATEIILVTDGYSDEAVLPLVQSRVPVSSVRRIVVKHSESIEETAARIALGVPGLLFFLYGVLSIIPGAVNYYLLSIVLILGGVLLLKGFGVDRGVKNLYKWAKEYSPPPLPVQISNYAIIAGILCVAISVYLGVANASANAPVLTSTAEWIAALPKLAGFFIKGVTDLLIVGIIIGLFGRSIRLYFERDVRLLRNVALIVSVAWFRWILNGTADILFEPGIGFNSNTFSNLVFAIVVGILIAIASVLVIFILHRSAKGFFLEDKEKEDEFGERTLASKEPDTTAT